MLKRLKIKFVFVIMLIVTLLFGATFGLIMHFTKQNLERESLEMMRGMAFIPPVSKPLRTPDKKPDNVRLPCFTVRISKSGEIVDVSGDYFNLDDQEMLTEIVNAVDDEPDQTGILHKYDLRFMKSEFLDMRLIVFADVSGEKAMLNGLVRNSVIIGLIGYAVFFVISLLLANWVTKPVEKTWNEQKQFIADASHELKTPITVIMTNAEMLTDKNYTENDRENFARNILSTSKRMRGLVESLLELARLDNNRTPIQLAAVDCSKLVNDSILPFEPLFYESGFEIVSDIANGIQTEGNKEKLQQVVNILLDNALKYSDPSDNVTVRLEKHSSSCILSVSGAGTLLSDEDCRNIFKRFYRIDESRNDNQSYGLGLSIAESIIKEHNGKIWAESENGHNTFFVSLPVLNR